MLLQLSPKSALATAVRTANHRMVCAGKGLKDHLVDSPEHLPLQQAALSPVEPAWNASRGGASTASLGNLLLHSNKL